MAITWDVKIVPLDVDRKEANITAIRTDDADPENIKTETHIVMNAVLETSAQKIAVLDNLWQQHLAYQQRQIKIDAYVGDLETQAKDDLEGRES